MVVFLEILVKVFDAAATVKLYPLSHPKQFSLQRCIFPSFFSASFAPFLHFLLFGHLFCYYNSIHIIVLQTRYYIYVFK